MPRLNLVEDLRTILRAHEHVTRKALGQHFLVSRHHLEAIADAIVGGAIGGASGVPFGVVEIGCGPGNLTQLLLERGATVWAAELDRSYAPLHEEAFADELAGGRLHVERADFLKTEMPAALEWFGARGLPPERIVVAGNIPYQITSPLLFRLCEWWAEGLPLRAAVFLMQAEVARRATAPPGGKEYGVMTAKLGTVADATIVLQVPPGAFWPPPRVRSAVLSILPKTEAARPPAAELAAAWDLMERAFRHRRKMLAKTLAEGDAARREAIERWLAARGHSPQARPESLGPGEWTALARALGAAAAA